MNIAISIGKSNSQIKNDRLAVTLVHLNAYKPDDMRFVIADDKDIEITRNPDITKSMIASAVIGSQKIDAVFFIDDNMLFDPEHLVRMAKHIRDGKPVVSVNYVNSICGVNGNEPSRVQRVGTAFTIVHRRVFERIGTRMPLCNFNNDKNKMFPFFMPMIKKANIALFKKEHYYLDGDESFCVRAIDCGFELWIDPTISVGSLNARAEFVERTEQTPVEVGVKA